MADPKILNLDELGESEIIKITLKGKDHEMAEMSVKDFIWAQKRMKKVETDDDESFNNIVEMLERQFPTVPKEQFQELPVSKLTALIKFTNSYMMDGAEQAITEQVEAEGKS